MDYQYVKYFKENKLILGFGDLLYAALHPYPDLLKVSHEPGLIETL